MAVHLLVGGSNHQFPEFSQPTLCVLMKGNVSYRIIINDPGIIGLRNIFINYNRIQIVETIIQR